MINAGVDLMMKTAMLLLGKQVVETSILTLQNVAPTEEEDRDEDPQRNLTSTQGR
jgi:hypothetical protein